MVPDNKKRVHGTRGASKTSNIDKNTSDDLQEAVQTNQSRNMKIKAQVGSEVNGDAKKNIQMKNQGNIRSQQGTGSSGQQQQQQLGRKRKQEMMASNNKQSIPAPIKNGYEIDEDEEEDIENIDNQRHSMNKEYIINNNNMNLMQIQQQKINQLNSQQNKDLIHNTFQSPQSLLEESKENTSECNSTSTKLRRSARNTTDSKCSSSNKTTPVLISPSKNARTNKRGHIDDQSQDELEPALRKQIQKSFMENSQKIEEPESDLEQIHLINNAQVHQYNKLGSMDIENLVNSDMNQIEEEHLNYLKQENKGRNTRQNYRQPINKKGEIKSSMKSNTINQDESKEDMFVSFSQDKDQTYQNNSEQINQQNDRSSRNHSEAGQEGVSSQNQKNIRVQKINFLGFSDSDDNTGDSNSQNNKKSNKSVTLIIQRNNKKNNASRIKEEIDGQSQSFQSGNLLIQICNTDEHYPPLFNQQYLEDNINLIIKKQSHVRQKRRLLQLDSINSVSIDKNNIIYNLLDMNVIKQREEGNLKYLNGIVEYEQTLRPQPMTKQKVKCNCKKSKCLKLYCDCFNQGQVCSSDCNCHDCSNTDQNKSERDSAIKQLQERNPDAFKPKIQTKQDDEEILVHNKGCNCKKSGCEKKYCECYNTGVKCSDQCKCEGCRNRDPSQLVKINNTQNNPSAGNSSFSNHLSNNKQVEQYLNEDIFQHSHQSMIHHNSNLIGNNLLRQSQDDSIPNYSQNSKKLYMDEFNTNINTRLGQGMGMDSQNIFSQKYLNNISGFQFSQDENKNNQQSRYSQNLSQNNINKFYGSIGGFQSSQLKGGFFDDNSQKSIIYKTEDNNTTIDVCLQNGQIKNIVAKQE